MSAHKYSTSVGKNSEEIVANILTCIETCFGRTWRKETHALGVGVAGQVDLAGVVRYAPNLNLGNVPLKSTLQEKLDLPVLVTNDVRAAAWGEWRFGSGRDVNDLVVIFIGTGVGGGIISISPPSKTLNGTDATTS